MIGIEAIKGRWIGTGERECGKCPVFIKEFTVSKKAEYAELRITARGVYEAEINGSRVGDFIMAPGWTVYGSRLQYQVYDVTDMLRNDNVIRITVSGGWYAGRISGGEDCWHKPDPERFGRREAVIAELIIRRDDGVTERIATDGSWLYGYGELVFGDIYDGEVYDATRSFEVRGNAAEDEDQRTDNLIPTVGEPVTEHERIKGVRLIITPKGERVIDFGQNLTGYPEITVNASRGDTVSLSFAEILDKDGNFYNENYRSAKCLYRYTCAEGRQRHKPAHTFYGFRYIRLDEFPSGDIDPGDFTAVAVHSDIRRIGHFESSDGPLNRLYENIIWGQKSNYLDVPTDCPQRDERFGYTGDAQVFIKAACMNFDVRRFFDKWLGDVMLLQPESGAIQAIAPAVYGCEVVSAGWGDAVTICPWELYQTYGDTAVLERTYPAMERWLKYIADSSEAEYLWTGHFQFGDWLELTERGHESDKELIASAFYAHSCMLTYKAGCVIGADCDKYKRLFERIRAKYIECYEHKLHTQTEYALTLAFGLTDDPQRVANELHDRIIADGRHLTTGFLGTPHLLHVLTDFGCTELAYDLLLRTEYPSWLYPVTRGATTMWEHWDGIRPDGSVCDPGMNSYNHYAYGAVADWLYEKAAGICRVEEHPGFEQVRFEPHPTDRLGSLSASIDTAYGKVASSWRNDGGDTVYEFVSPVKAVAVIDGAEYPLKTGKNTIISDSKGRVTVK